MRDGRELSRDGFLEGGGEMGAQARALAAGGELGHSREWPQSLRTALSMVLESAFPMCLAWGPRLIQLYNDGYRRVLGPLHPRAFGTSARATFASSWEEVGPLFEGALRGAPGAVRDVALASLAGPDAEDGCFSFSCSPVRDESGGVGGVLIAATETPGRALLQRVESAHRSEMRRVFMGAPVFIALLRGPEHIFELANDAYLRLVGRQALEGKAMAEVLPASATQGFLELLDRVYLTGEPYVGTEVAVQVGSAGHHREAFITFTFQPFRDPAGCIEGVAIFGTDLTETVAARRSGELLVQKAQLAERRKDEFLAMLGHELRNPLAPIVTAVQLMKLRREPGSERERQIIERQVAHLSRLVDDLLDVSRIARGKIDLKRRPVEAAEMVGKAIEMASPLLEQRTQQLAVEVPREGLLIDGDPIRLAQVMANLLTNAAKYTPPHGHILVGAAREGREVVLHVEDDGIGIPQEMQPHIFDLFVQSERALDRAEGGLGLGLALVKNLAMLHGGSVSCRSAGLDRGSRFELRLPALDQQAHALLLESTPVPVRAPRRRRVLVVDDNEDAAVTLAEVLRMRGHEVEVAPDGPAALELLGRFHAEVGLLDLGLPVMDGYELARRICELPLRPLRLVAITGYGQEHDRTRSSAAGFDLHLIKPVELDLVTAAVES